MDRKSVKRKIVTLAASALFAAAVGPSYAGCWGSCEGSLSLHNSGEAAPPISAPDADYNYHGKWGIDLTQGRNFAPLHQGDIDAYGPKWGGDWSSERSSQTDVVSHSRATSRTN